MNSNKNEAQFSRNAENFMDGFNKSDIQKKLKEIGMGSIADKLEPLSEQAIENMLRANPQILKKAMEIFNNGRQR